MSDTPLQAALAAYHAGDFREAAARSRHALEAAPGDEGLGSLLAMAEHAAGNHAAAADAFHALARAHPGVADYWSNLGYMLRLDSRYGEADAAFQQALALAPRESAFLVNHGLLLLDMGRLGAARNRFLDAVEADPGSLAARIYAASACFECGDIRRAANLIPPRDTWATLDSDLRHDLAMTLIHVGRIDDAEQVLDPDAFGNAEPGAIVRLAMLHERTNRIDSAKALLDRIREVPPGHDVQVDALTVEAALAMREKDYARARDATQGLLDLDPPAPAVANAYFTLATIADKQRRVDEAMDMLARAHAIHLRLAEEIVPEFAQSDAEPLRIAMKRMDAAQCDFAPDPDAPGPDQSPVFIVGFPRSGTTMLEQMLDAHPGYVSMDEQPILQRCIEQMEATGLEYPYQLDRLDRDGLRRIRAVYWEEVGRICPPGDRILVDKNPLNLLRLPMIRRLFPSARIILALRHPCDVILSCYMQNFRSPAFMVLCASLERLARSYANSMQCWIHHQQLLDPDVLLLRYEDTVSDFDRQVALIAAFLGIDEQHHLAAFSQHAARKGYISTPSYSQVIEPVNTRAVARWEAYRAYFDAALPILQPVAAHWGYGLEKP